MPTRSVMITPKQQGGLRTFIFVILTTLLSIETAVLIFGGLFAIDGFLQMFSSSKKKIVVEV